MPTKQAYSPLDLKLFHWACTLATVVLSFGTFQIQRLKDEVEEGKKMMTNGPFASLKSTQIPNKQL